MNNVSSDGQALATSEVSQKSSRQSRKEKLSLRNRNFVQESNGRSAVDTFLVIQAEEEREVTCSPWHNSMRESDSQSSGGCVIDTMRKSCRAERCSKELHMTCRRLNGRRIDLIKVVADDQSSRKTEKSFSFGKQPSSVVNRARSDCEIWTVPRA